MKIMKKPHIFPPRPLIYKLQQEVLKCNGICVVGAPKTWPGDDPFNLRKSKFGVRHFLLIVTFK